MVYNIKDLNVDYECVMNFQVLVIIVELKFIENYETGKKSISCIVGHFYDTLICTKLYD